MTRERRVGRFLVWIAGFALAAVSLLGWAYASAPGSSPDDDFHLASIWCGVGERAGLCEQAPIQDQRLIPADVLGATCHVRDEDSSAACIIVEDARAMVPTDRGNFDGLYPPVFYAVTGIFASDDVWGSIAGIRLFNGLVFLVFLGALLLFSPRWARAPATLIPIVTLVPLGLYLVASVNPSSWAITSALVVTCALLLIPGSDGARRIGLVAVAVLGTALGAGARADAGLYAVLAVVVALVLGLRRARSAWWLVATGVAIVVIAALSYLGAGQSSAATEGLMGRPPASLSDALFLFATNFFEIPQLWAGVFGYWDLGWFDLPLKSFVWVIGWAVFAIALWVGLRRIGPRKAVALGIAFAAVWGYPLLLHVQSQTYVGSFVQPRYVLPGMIILIVVALLDEPTTLRLADHGAAQRWIVVLGLGIANALALFSVIRRYVTGNDAGGLDLDAGIEWWWTESPAFSPMVVWALGSAAFAALLVLVLGRRPRAVASLEA